MDVIFYEVFKEEEEAIRGYLPSEVKAAFISATIQESGHGDPDAKIISVRTQSKIPPEWAGKIDAILTRSQGYDHIIDYAESAHFKGKLGFLDNYCARAVAEHAVLSMMILLRKLKRQTKQFETFNRDGLTGLECLNKNVCVIGVGNIGSQMVDLAKGLKMSVKGVDIDEKFKDVQYVSLKEGVAWADIIFCALPLTKETKNMLNYESLKGAKRQSLFINISRGEISPVKDLKKLLDENILGAIALDIYEDEKSLAAYLRGGNDQLTEANTIILELSKRDNVLCTPHNAFNTHEALKEKAKRSAQAVAAYMNDGRFPHPVELP